MTEISPQDEFWTGEFGNEYIKRNRSPEMVHANMALFSKVMCKTFGIKTVLEFGASIGLNLLAIEKIIPKVELSAIEINEQAVSILRAWKPGMKIYNTSILNFECDYQRDFVFTKGVLIHMPPQTLPAVYEKLYSSSNKYICVAEYYNPTPMEIPYRGHANMLFKRDFAGEMLDMYPDLRLTDYGFVYHRDRSNPLDDISWFMMKKEILDK